MACRSDVNVKNTCLGIFHRADLPPHYIIIGWSCKSIEVRIGPRNNPKRKYFMLDQFETKQDAIDTAVAQLEIFKQELRNEGYNY